MEVISSGRTEPLQCRRGFLIGTAGACLAGAVPLEARSTTLRDRASRDLKDVEVIDTHVHTLKRMLISQSYERQQTEFTQLFVPKGEFSERDRALALARAGATDLVWNAPRRIGYFNYVARAYNVPATIEGFNSITQKHIVSDAAFSDYISSILRRENVSHVVLQADAAPPAPPVTHIASKKYVWTSPVHFMTRVGWAQELGFRELDDVLETVSRNMADSVQNGCRGFKDGSGYYRPRGFSQTNKREAAVAFKQLLDKISRSRDSNDDSIKLTPGDTFPNRPEVLTRESPSDRRALDVYQDYVFKHIYIEAGRLQRPMIIHSAVALHPYLQSENNDPRPLYNVFVDPDIQRARTTFVIIHSGYPNHEVVSAFISQFPNVYTDISFFSKYPGITEDIYRTFLGLGPSNKIMHGSDANTVPEEIGYCAWNTRTVLARVLHDYRTSYGWTARDVAEAAENILNRNARKVFQIT